MAAQSIRGAADSPVIHPLLKLSTFLAEELEHVSLVYRASAVEVGRRGWYGGISWIGPGALPCCLPI